MEQYGTRSVATMLQRVQCTVVALAAIVAFTAGDASAAPAKKAPAFNVVPILVQSVTVTGGQLMANGIAGSQAFSTPITLTPGAVAPGATCPILNLSLGP